MNDYLFIGGNQNGKFLSPPAGAVKICFPVFPKLKVKPLDYLTELPDKLEYKLEYYYLEQLKAKTSYYIYRHESLTIDDVLEKLILQYNAS